MLTMSHSLGLALLVAVVLCRRAFRRNRPVRARATSGSRPACSRPGPLNAITDVAGVRVGHTTLVTGDAVRTGVTVVVPHGGNLFQEKVPGAVFVGNAFGKLAGSTQVDELGTIETPIALTNTLSVGAAVEGLVQWTLAQTGNADVRSVNALVGETNDGGLNDIRGLHVRPEHVRCGARRGDATAPSTRAASARAPARARSGGRAASAPRRGASSRAMAATPSACWCRATTAAC